VTERPQFGQWIASLSDEEITTLIRSLPPEEARAVEADWSSWAHDGQCGAVRLPQLITKPPRE
jgi:hypothetical protein